MHYLAGVLLVVDVVLLWTLERSIDMEALSYLGWAVWLAGMVLLVLTAQTLRRRGRAPEGSSYVETRVLVEAGIYGVVRHPMYLGWMLMYGAVLLFNPNLPILVLSVLGAASVYLVARQEDGRLAARFGAPYRRYMRSVPRMNLLVGLVRLARRGR
jgi:protein-S-isoprenylcysteine O-methyltransferase Ste14